VNPLVVVGHPNNRFEHIYVNASSMVGPLFYIQGGVSTSMSAIEINAASLGPTLIKDTAGGGWSVDAIRVEGGTYGAGASAVNAMFDMSASSLRIDRLELGPLTINSTGGGNNYIFDTSLSACHLGILTMNPAIITITGNWWLAQQATGTVTVDTLATNTFPTNFYLTNMPGTITAKQIQVLDWLKGAISADKGDANYTVALGDPNIITYATNLTAARTVTLPASSSAINSHLFDGLWYRVVRSGAGAFDLKINDATGATLLDSIVSGKTGAIEYTYRRGGWVQTLKAVA
jgi:hypothetical protein